MPLSPLALRQSTAELLACALCELFPKTLIVNSVATDIGFYCDVVCTEPLIEETFPVIEERMRMLARNDIPIKTLEMLRPNAVAFFTHHGQRIKAEQLADAPEGLVSIFQMGNFIDICPEPYGSASSDVLAFKLLKLSSYSHKFKKYNAQRVFRIEGCAAESNSALKQFLKQLEKAYQSDHRLLIPQMHLLSEITETGCWIWQQRGLNLRNLLLQTAKNKKQSELSLPSHLNIDLNTFFTHFFKNQPLSSSQLPLHYQLTLPQVNDLPKEQLWGLFRSPFDEINVTAIVCDPQQIQDEVISSLQFINKIIKIFGFKHHWYLNSYFPKAGTRRGDEQEALLVLKNAFEAVQLNYTVEKQPEAVYGPSIELKIEDSLERQWPASFLAIWTNQPDLTYQENGITKKPKILLRSDFGPMQRFVALLIELNSGKLPLWLVPEQVRIIPSSQGQNEYAVTVYETVAAAGLRSYIDDRSTGLAEKIRAAEIEKIPYLLILGEKEKQNTMVQVRSENCANTGKEISLTAFLQGVLEQCRLPIFTKT